MSKQATFSDDRFSSVTPLDSIEHDFTTTDEDAYTYKTLIEFDRDRQSWDAVWYLEIQGSRGGPPDVDRMAELLGHLNADADAVLSAILEHTDLRTVKDGSCPGKVLVDECGDIVGFELVEVYVGEPSVQVAHDELEADLQALNPE